MSVDPKPWGFDVSQHQGRPNMATLRRENYDVGIVKVSEGWGWEEPDGRANLHSAIFNGHVPGAYHYIWGNDPQKQVSSYLRAIRAVTKPEKVMLIVDVEPHEGPASEQPRWEHVRRFVGHLHDAVPRHPIVIYCGEYWRRPGGLTEQGNPRIFDLPVPDDLLYLWLSRYVTATDVDWGSVLYERVPESWWDDQGTGALIPTGIQFASTARTKAVTPLDVTAWRPDYAGMRRLAGLRDERMEPLVDPPEGINHRGWDKEKTLRMVREIEYGFPVRATTYEGHGTTGENLAADFWVARIGEAADENQRELGYELARYLVQHWGGFDIEYIIWDNEMKERREEGWFDYEPIRKQWEKEHPNVARDLPTSCHRNHVHVSLAA
jgi:hypothetical protein